jgi:copper chaperone CopZ
MNSFKTYFSLFAFTLLFSVAVNAQKNDPITLKFEVSGICEMCKERIEKALDTKGIRFANWDVETGELEVVYKPNKISEEEIHQRIADVGHDTEKVTASDEAYDSVHHCCKYREDTKH